MIVPGSFDVASLNLRTKSPMLTPCWPRAGPTGGAGVACPPGHCSLTLALISFFAMASFLDSHRFDLPVLQLHRCGAAEDGDDHAHEALGGHHVVDDALEGLQRAFLDLDRVALLHGDLELRRAGLALLHVH